MRKPSQKQVFRDITDEAVTKGAKSFRKRSILSSVTFNTQYTSPASQARYKVGAQELLQDKRLEKITVMNVIVPFHSVVLNLCADSSSAEQVLFSLVRIPCLQIFGFLSKSAIFHPEIGSIRREGTRESTLSQFRTL